MEKLSSIDEILDFAIGNEEESAAFYSDLAQQTVDQAMSRLFESFAGQELGHKAKLQAIKDGVIPAPARRQVMDLKIAEYVIDVKPGPNMKYQDALILAMKREKATFKMYNDLSAMTEDEVLREAFLTLAQEEARHKLRIEVEYDEHVLTEN